MWHTIVSVLCDLICIIYNILINGIKKIVHACILNYAQYVVYSIQLTCVSKNGARMLWEKRLSDISVVK